MANWATMPGHRSGNWIHRVDPGTARLGVSHLQAGVGREWTEPGWPGAGLFLEHPVHDEYAFFDLLQPGLLFWLAGTEGS